MKVFVAGATGVLGRALVPRLVAQGHEVVGMTGTASKEDLLRSLGAQPVVADALDRDAVAQVVASAEPEVIVHQLTVLSRRAYTPAASLGFSTPGSHEIEDAEHDLLRCQLRLAAPDRARLSSLDQDLFRSADAAAHLVARLTGLSIGQLLRCRAHRL